MFKNKKLLLFIVFSVIFLNILFFSLNTAPVSALGFEGIPTSQRLDNMAKKVNLGNEKQLPEMIGIILYSILGFLGIACLIIIIAGGIMWMMAGGNEESMSKAKGMIKGAVIGVVIILVSYTITYYVVNKIIESTNPVSSINDGSITDCCLVRIDGEIKGISNISDKTCADYCSKITSVCNLLQNVCPAR